jgi:hypothetical protein
MWDDVPTKPLQGRKFKDMGAFLQHCPRDYEDETEQNNLMNPQDIASLGECVGEHAKNAREKGGQNKSPCCVLWADKTWSVSHDQTRQGSTPCHVNTSHEGIQKQNHMDNPRGQNIQKIHEKQHHVDKRYAHKAKGYARNKGESNHKRSKYTDSS